MTDPINNRPWYELHPIKSALAVTALFGGIWTANYFIYNEKANNLNIQIASAKTTAESYKAQKELAEQRFSELSSKISNQNDCSSFSAELKKLKEENITLKSKTEIYKDKNQLIDQVSTLKTSLKQSEKRIIELESENKTLKERSLHDTVPKTNNNLYSFIKEDIKYGQMVFDPVTKTEIGITTTINDTPYAILSLPGNKQTQDYNITLGKTYNFTYNDKKFKMMIIKLDAKGGVYSISINELE